ncbi:MAG: ABC transporter substrate-binding protein [Candidatus Methanomethylophilaceae archaeon]|nr:ABC transporter substrate-binding protein [Candidatus Methanomethylophilaceae archaeon]
MANKNTIIVIAAVVVVAIVAVAAFAVMNNNGGGSDTKDGARVGEQLKESDFPDSGSRLWIYGNANEDDKLDSSDVVALENMVKGSVLRTQLADANADGEVDDKDVTYLKSILAATESTKIDVYYVDNYFKVAKVSWPVKSIATSYCSGLYTAEATGLTDKIAMVDSTIADYWAKLNSYAEKAKVFGDTGTPNYELMIQNKIDVYVPGYCDAKADAESVKKLNPAGIDVMFMNTCDNSGVEMTNEYIDRSIVMFGFLLQGDMDQTYEWLAWHDGILTKAKAAVATLKESDRCALIMSRNAPSYTTTGQYSITGKGNTNMIHADWAGCYVVADHSSSLPKNYNNLKTEDILTVLKQTADAGHTTVYWIDNEHDGLRGQLDLDVTVASWEEELKTAIPDMHYLGMAREAGNSPLYIIEVIFYLNVMHPGLLDLDFEEQFEYFIDHFTLETSKYTSQMDMDNFFKDYGTY